jgi:hypothetical protein
VTKRGVYTLLLQICKQGCCEADIRMCSHCLFPVVVTSLEQFAVTRLMMVTDLLQVVPTRLIETVRDKLLQTCCHQLVKKMLRTDDIRLVGTISDSVGLINLATRR